MKKFLLLIFISLISLHHEMIAQNSRILVSGTIIDESGLPIPGVNIYEKGTSNGTMTNFDGDFSLNVSGEDAVLVASYVGFKTQEVTVGNQTEFTFTLEIEQGQLDEVVVIGYQKVHQREITGAVSSISSDDIEGIPVVNVADIIATQSTGLQSINLSGAPGARGGIVIRGNTSISGNIDVNTAFSNPLYVVDGVQTSLEDLAGYNVSNTDFLASLNPNDIESIDILKDASAAAIYGSRGANGVIIITTKGGAALEKPEFNFSSSIGFAPIPDLVPMLVGAAERREKMGMVHRWWNHDSKMTSQVPIMLTDSINPVFNNNVDYQVYFIKPESARGII